MVANKVIKNTEENFEIRDLEKSYKKYADKFKESFEKPVTEREIIEKIPNMFASSFKERYLPRLQKLNMIIVFKKDKKSISYLKKFYDVEWIDNRTPCYYFFTPKSAKVSVILRGIIKQFEGYLKNKKEIIENYKQLIRYLRNYEFCSHTNKEYFNFEKRDLRLWERLLKEGKISKEEIKEYLKKVKERQYIQFGLINNRKTKKGALVPIKKIQILDLDGEKIGILSDKVSIENPFFDRLLNEVFFVPRKINGKNQLVILYVIPFTTIPFIEAKFTSRRIIELLNQDLNLTNILERQAKLNKNSLY